MVILIVTVFHLIHLEKKIIEFTNISNFMYSQYFWENRNHFKYLLQRELKTAKGLQK